MQRPQTVAKESQDSLHQQLKDLEQQWHTLKQSKPRPPMLRRCSTDSKAIVKSLQLINMSPRGLMSSLQQERVSPSVEERARERRLGIESGELKGRRLFGGFESDTEVGFGGNEDIRSECFDLAQDGEVRSMCSYGYEDENDDDLGRFKEEVARDGRVEREEVVVEHGVEEKRYGGGKLMLLMAWFSIFLMVFTLGIISMKCNEEYGDEDEVILIPT